MGNIVNNGDFLSAAIQVAIWIVTLSLIALWVAAFFYVVRKYSGDIKIFFTKIWLATTGCYGRLVYRIKGSNDVEKIVEYTDLNDASRKNINARPFEKVVFTLDDIKNIHVKPYFQQSGKVLVTVRDFKVLTKEEYNPDAACSVCLKPFSSDSPVSVLHGREPDSGVGDIVQLPCQHVFHADCMSVWIGIKKGEIKQRMFDDTQPEYYDPRIENFEINCPLCRLDLNRCKMICDQTGLKMKKISVRPN